jgi:hypothetical protein
MTDRTRGRRERVLVSALLREASEGLEAAAGPRLIGCKGFAITCERRATAQALQHLLRHAQALPGADRFEIMARPDPAGVLELRAPGAGGTDKSSDGAPLHIILARLLLQTQGASLECSSGEGCWSARVGFPAQG